MPGARATAARVATGAHPRADRPDRIGTASRDGLIALVSQDGHVLVSADNGGSFESVPSLKPMPLFGVAARRQRQPRAGRCARRSRHPMRPIAMSTP